MSFGKYLYSKAVTLCFWAIGALLLAVFMRVADADAGLVCTAELFLVVMVAAWLALGYLVERARLGQLERVLDELPKKYLAGEVLPPPANALEREYFRIMKTVSRAAIGAVERAERDKEEYCEYVERWIHEIKTPLTACSLILSNGGDARKLRRELKRADNLTESILFYARMRSLEKDTQISEINVSAVIEEAVKSQMDLLIAARIGVETNGDFSVYTDGKALCFILKQLLINCAKYCQGCRVTMTAGNGVLTVEDNGIGIPAHEIDRVTERGFTGKSGGRAGGGTGMGLYIVSGLCEQLGITLEIQSERNQYTRVILSFDSLTKL